MGLNSEGPLRATSWLGDNTLPLLDAVATGLTAAGIPAEAHVPADRSSAGARCAAAEFDLVWMCGALAMSMLADGALRHDVVAAPVFAGETEPVYRSVFVVSVDGPSDVESALGGMVAVNERESWSGHLGARRHVEQLHGRWFESELLTGSHQASIDAVASGRAVGAWIDESIWTATVDDASADDLTTVAVTGDWPAPPLLLAQEIDSPTRRQIIDALLGLSPMGIERFAAVDRASYLSMG